MRTLLALTAATALIIGSAGSWASDYPTRPITFIVPYAAGGSNDVLSRVLTEHMSKTLGQPIVVENEAGAAGTTAATHVSRAAPDGYTLMMGNMGTHAVAVVQYPGLNYAPVKDFSPIGIAAEVPAEIMPNVPTTRVAGLPKFIASTWNAVFAPKGVPPEIQGKLNAALRKALED